MRAVTSGCPGRNRCAWRPPRSRREDVDPPRKTISAIRAEQAPVLDGRLDDPVWQQAAFVEDLHIVVSDEYGEPGERSRVYVAYDDDNLYFAARFWDSKPEQVVAKVLNKRDTSFGEDGFSITLDPYDQGRSRLHVRRQPERHAQRSDLHRRRSPELGLGGNLGCSRAARRGGLDRGGRHTAQDAFIRPGAWRLGRQLHALARQRQRAVRLGLLQPRSGPVAHRIAARPQRTATGPRPRRDSRVSRWHVARLRDG